jgi:hypothetical protein
MSGWIKMGTGLASHPKVKALRRSLKADRLRVVGGLWAVWCVFDEHSASGRLDGYTLDDMDDEIGWRGFAAAMRDIGWLLEDADGLEAPDYEEHNGPNAKRRALDASRKGRSRASKTDTDPEHDPPQTRTEFRSEAGQMSASDADNVRNREEKRREEREKTENQARAAAYPPPQARAPDGVPPEQPGGHHEDPPEAAGHQPTKAGLVCRAMRRAGIAAVNPGDPRLLTLLEQGATEAEFAGLAAEAAAKGKGFAWVLAALAARRTEAAAISLAPTPTVRGEPPEEYIARQQREREEEAARIAAPPTAVREKIARLTGRIKA